MLVAVEFCWHDTVSMVVRRRPLFANSKGGARLIADGQLREMNVRNRREQTLECDLGIRAWHGAERLEVRSRVPNELVMLGPADLPATGSIRPVSAFTDR